jgi:hypothetical protein
LLTYSISLKKPTDSKKDNEAKVTTTSTIGTTGANVNLIDDIFGGGNTNTNTTGANKVNNNTTVDITGNLFNNSIDIFGGQPVQQPKPTTTVNTGFIDFTSSTNMSQTVNTGNTQFNQHQTTTSTGGSVDTAQLLKSNTKPLTI